MSQSEGNLPGPLPPFQAPTEVDDDVKSNPENGLSSVSETSEYESGENIADLGDLETEIKRTN